jgi:hypothetical protein
MEVSGQLHTPAALPPGKETRYPLDRRLSGLQSRSGRGGEERDLLFLILLMNNIITTGTHKKEASVIINNSTDISETSIRSYFPTSALHFGDQIEHLLSFTYVYF